MYKKFLGVVAIVFSLALSQTVFAGSWGCDGMKKIVDSLKLDDAQKAKIKPVLDQLKSNVKDNWTQMKDVDTQIDQQNDSATMDQATVDSLVDKKTKLIGNIIKAKITAKNQIAAVLNPEQKGELQNKVKQLREKIAAKFKSCHEED